LVSKIDAEISGLHQSRELAQACMVEAQAELEQIGVREVNRRDHLAFLRQQLASLQTEVQSAHNVATRSTDLPLVGKESAKKLRDLQRALSKQTETLRQAEEKYAVEEAQDTARRAELEQIISQAQEEISQVERTLVEAQDAKKKAWEELGKEEHNEVKDWLEGHEKEVDEHRKALLNLELRRVAFLEERMSSLRDWPEHFSEMRKQVPYEDEIVRALEGLKLMLEALLSNPRMIPANLPTTTHPTMAYYGGSLAHLFEIRLEEFYALLRGDSQTLQVKLSKVTSILEEAKAAGRLIGER
jgi:predicted  nucleic acid-binding Zn-ribbon protein